MENGKIVSVQNAEHYTWGQNNDGWHLLKSDALSVIEERMPPGNFEQKHYHQKSRQVFYILLGEAHFEIADQTVTVAAGQSIYIEPGTVHGLFNKSSQDLRFIVISCPQSHGDRINM